MPHEFTPQPKTWRWNRPTIITEKLDGPTAEKGKGG